MKQSCISCSPDEKSPSRAANVLHRSRPAWQMTGQNDYNKDDFPFSNNLLAFRKGYSMNSKNEIVLFEYDNIRLEVPVTPEQETVWLTQEQMALLFDTARSSIAYHIGNIFRENELDQNASVEIFDRSIRKASRPPMYYNLDVIISVGYRVKSQRGIAFRRWANSVLKEYIIKGYALNNNRINQLGEVIRIMKRTENNLDSRQVLSVIEKYSEALNLLDSYDHQNMARLEGTQTAVSAAKIIAATHMIGTLTACLVAVAKFATTTRQAESN